MYGKRYKKDPAVALSCVFLVVLALNICVLPGDFPCVAFSALTIVVENITKAQPTLCTTVPGIIYT